MSARGGRREAPRGDGDPYADSDIDAAIGVACLDLTAARVRMLEAKLTQAMTLLADLARVVRSLAPEHPVLDSVFVEASDA